MGIKDKLFYKQRPYIYAGLAFVALFFARNSKLALICGVVLMICSYLVFEMRKTYQEKQAMIDRNEFQKTAKRDGVVVIDDK